MNENYLWDRTGEPDPQTAELEELLSRFRFTGTPPRAHFHLRPKRRSAARKTWSLLSRRLCWLALRFPHGMC
jgi:hypothetical protein